MSHLPRLLPALGLALFMSYPGVSIAQQGRKPLVTPSATCPIQLKYLQLKKNHLEFQYRNSSDKELQGIIFGLAYYDSVQDPHRVAVTGGINRHLRPGKLWKSELDISYWRNSGYDGWTLWPSKILFTDGTIWKMGAEPNACSIVNWHEKQITPPPLPAAVLGMPAESAR